MIRCCMLAGLSMIVTCSGLAVISSHIAYWVSHPEHRNVIKPSPQATTRVPDAYILLSPWARSMCCSRAKAREVHSLRARTRHLLNQVIACPRGGGKGGQSVRLTATGF